MLINTVILYPFVEGRNGREIALSGQHWREFGIALKRLHTATLPSDLIGTYEVGAMQRGVQAISLGAIEGAKGFYERMGYHGKSSMHKELPLPGRVLALRLKKLESKLGDLEVGQVVQTDETGKIPSLF